MSETNIRLMAAAKEFGDAKWGSLDHLTVSMSHPDAQTALLSGASDVKRLDLPKHSVVDVVPLGGA